MCAAVERGGYLKLVVCVCLALDADLQVITFFEELAAARKAWSQALSPLDLALSLDYREFSAAEVGPERAVPRTLQHAMNFDFGLQEQLAWERPPPSRDVGPDDADDETQLQRALEASRQAEESRQRRQLVDEQEAEYRASLAADYDKSHQDPSAAFSSASALAGAEHVAENVASINVEDSVAQLVDMGFDICAARTALQASGGDISVAVVKLTCAS